MLLSELRDPIERKMVGTVSLDDILVTPLKRISTNGGDVMHALKNTDQGFNGFGEVYFSWIEQGAIKGWKCHQRMTLNLVVPSGKVRFVFCLNGKNNDSRVEDIGEERNVRLTVPPGVWFAFQGKASRKSLLMNVANMSPNPDEILVKPVSSIFYDWNIE